MRTIIVLKDELREIVQANRDEHRNDFLEAQEKFRERVVEELERRLEDARQGRQVDMAIRLPVPEDHTADYDRVLRMLDISVGDTIELEEDDVACYVQDDWAWKRAWISTMSNYSGKFASR